MTLKPTAPLLAALVALVELTLGASKLNLTSHGACFAFCKVTVTRFVFDDAPKVLQVIDDCDIHFD
jgi:hypothetical protein